MQKQYNMYLSFYAVYLKESRRFMKVWGQTILGPLINIGLFLIIFSNAFDSSESYLRFLIPGLVMMAIINNAFANPSSSLFIAKINGYIVDIIMAPIPTVLVVLGYVLGAIVRSFIVSIVLLIYGSFFISVSVHNIFIVIYFFFIASTIMALVGFIVGIISTKADHLANFTNILITPLAFLSGTFYSVSKLPGVLQSIVKYNPIFFMIDGFRYGFTGASEANINVSISVLAGMAVVLFLVSCYLWKIGYKIRN